jgi:hypothetical protein
VIDAVNTLTTPDLSVHRGDIVEVLTPEGEWTYGIVGHNVSGTCWSVAHSGGHWATTESQMRPASADVPDRVTLRPTSSRPYGTPVQVLLDDAVVDTAPHWVAAVEAGLVLAATHRSTLDAVPRAL